MTDAQEVHPDWQTLLDWLATHGMDTSSAAIPVQARTTPGAGYGLFALTDCDPATRLFSVPASALFNMTTLSRIYPRARRHLTAIQLMSLHLFLYRPDGSRPSSDPIFGPYISTLPRNFASHPLTWLCGSKSENAGTVILSSLPPNIMSALREVADRYHADWAIVKQYLKQNDFPPSICEVVEPIIRALQFNAARYEESFLWAWLNVNTRCLYHRLEQLVSDKNNVTMCPIIDFANHTNRSNSMSPHEPIAVRAKVPSKSLGLDFALTSSSSTPTKQDDELFLKYGAHSNQTLFVEYGFVSEISAEHLLRGTGIGQIAVQCEIVDLFESRGKLGVWMKDVLQTEGYWGDWTLHCQPLPAHPSFRLITALRLFHVFPVTQTTVPLNTLSALESWRATIMGTSEKISEQNEEAWRSSLLCVCKKRADDAKSALLSLKGKAYSNDPAWMPWAKQNIMMLWEEELLVSTQVANSILQYEEF